MLLVLKPFSVQAGDAQMDVSPSGMVGFNFKFDKQLELLSKTNNLFDIDRPTILDEQDSLLNKNNKSRIQDILSKLINDKLVVHPGTEFPGINNSIGGREICRNNICQPASYSDYAKIDDSGHKLVNYSLHGFRAVGLLLINKTDGNFSTCNFVVIDKEWAVTAKHCIDKQNSNLPKRWLLLSQKAIDSTEVQLNPINCASTNTEKCNYDIIEPVVSDNYLTPSHEEESDIAFIRLNKDSLPQDFDTSIIPRLDFSENRLEIVTIIGNGMSNSKDYDNGRPQVGWFKGTIKENSSFFYLTPSLIESKPAPGDSGGPVYRGEYFGRVCEKSEADEQCRDYLLSGIVSNGKGNITSPLTAATTTTGIVRLSKYKNFICSLKGFKGCEL